MYEAVLVVLTQLPWDTGGVCYNMQCLRPSVAKGTNTCARIM